jgi:uncharacterized protein with FMN-binding domain
MERKRAMKKQRALLFVPVLSIALLMGIAGCRESESRIIREIRIPEVDLSTLEDGSYTGRYVHHDNLYETEVLIRDHRMESIRVLRSEGDEYDLKALPVIQQVIETQSLQVDSVTGATKSSKLYLITIYNALSEEEIDIQKLLQQ